MGILQRLFPAKTTITSAAIREEISKAESDLAAHRAKIEAANVNVALLSDEAHIQVEQEIAADRRAITRLEARVSLLTEQLPAVIAAEETAEAAAKDEALRKRAEDCRKANAVEAKQILAEVDKLSSRLGDHFARLKEIGDETNSVNQALHTNPVAERITCYENLYRSPRAGLYEFPFSEVVLPAAFTGGKQHWPRR